MRPTAADLLSAVAAIVAGEWIDPLAVGPVRWDCQLFEPAGQLAADGSGNTAAEAMALAWIALHAPDALIEGKVEEPIPFDIPASWRFELTPPWQDKRA